MEKQNKKYFDKLTLSMGDKLFFVDHITPSVLIDFGCALGDVGNEVLDYYAPDMIQYIGYDRTSVIEQAKEKNGHLKFTNDFDDLEFLVRHNDETENAMLLSSVLHEIYSNDDQTKFWRIVRKLHPKHIVIRDMHYGGSEDDYAPIEYRRMLDNMYGYEYISPKMKEVLQYILKYPHKDNWDYESSENYFSWNEKEVDFMMDVLGYKQMFVKRYVLPYFKELVHEKSEGKIDLNISTHIQMIYVRDDSTYPSLKFRKKYLSPQFTEI